MFLVLEMLTTFILFLETTFEKIKQCQESMKKPGGDIKKTTQWLEKNFLSKGLCLDSFFGTEKVDYFLFTIKSK